MDKGSVLNIIAEFKEILKQKGIEINKLVLYGSYAKLTQREGSDIDLIVVSDSFKNMDYWERIDIVSEAISELFQPIEAICITLEEWDNKQSFVYEYAKNGELV